MEVEEMQKQIESMMPTPQQIVEHLDKKLEEAKRLYETANSDQKYVLESLFPQLSESEDEKIRKEIIDFLLDGIWDTTIIDKVKQSQGYAKWISYLEKQGKQKFAWTEEDEIRIDSIIAFLKSPSLCVMDGNKDIIKANIKYLKFLKYRAQSQPKQEWSKEDEKIIGNIRRIIAQDAFYNDAVDVNGELCEKMYIDADNWLKSLKDRVAGNIS